MYFQIARNVLSRNPPKFVQIGALGARIRPFYDPSRFFNQLKEMGVRLDHCVALADHHAIGKHDIPDGCVIMTEKDAVKAVAHAHDNCWYQPVDAVLAEDFYTQLIQRIAR